MERRLRHFIAGSCAIFAFGACLTIYLYRSAGSRFTRLRPFADVMVGPGTEIYCGRRSILRGPHQKVLSYSLYGVRGKSRAAGPYEQLISGIPEYVNKWYPGWVMRIYTNYSRENEQVASWMKTLEDKFPNLDFCHVENLPGIVGDIQTTQSNGRVWRYLPMMDPLVDTFVSRDSDSPVSERESAAVKEWMESGYLFHAMKDHSAHHGPVFVGLWGAKVSQNRSFVHYLGRKMLFESEPSNDGGLDQYLLHHVLWNEAQQHFVSPALIPTAATASIEGHPPSLFQMVHASFNCDEFVGGAMRPYPTRREGGFWLGSGPRHHQFKQECPLKYRPKEHPDWVFC
ncbi:unnamed protein product [Darwinula stevensoni]|uniref:Uncharacterized protein n=1 Tax=Darwinula stevensoni TaxID=69355 RepID=A0A7R8XGZ7_9CRUS|nr:unnamed protein product [Darwinula stevensoni]CAG0893013.1 unnamed protein product [Darwinula stevensoni]